MSENTLTTDAQLVAAYVAGDRAALAAIYDRYGNALYDVAAAMLRNRHDAADVTQDTFVVAAERMTQLRDPNRLKPWLLAILRNEVYRRSGKRARQVPTDFTLVGADVALPPTYADEASAAEFEELATLVRDAAAGLDPRDQLVLELAVRQGLEGDELAAALGVTTQQSYSLVHRMRQRTERSLGAFCVARRGRRDCPELDRILAGWDGTFSVLIRKRVARHVDDCSTCERNRKQFVPLLLFGSAPAFAAPPDLRDRVLAAVDAGSYGLTSTAAATQPYAFTAPGGFPTGRTYSRRFVLWVLMGAAAAMLLIGAGVFVLAGGDQAAAQLAIDVPAVSTSTTNPAATLSTTTTTTTTTTAPSTTVPVVVPPSAPPTSAPPSTEATTTTLGPRKTTTTTTPATTTTTTTTDPDDPTTTTAAPTTTVAGSTTVAPTTTQAPTTTAAPTPPGALFLSNNALDFGTSTSTMTVQLANEGSGPAAWSASVAPGFAGGTPFDVSPTSGSLAPGSVQTLTVTMSRAGLAPGSSHSAVIRFTASGTATQLTARGSVDPAPTVEIVNVTYFCQNYSLSVRVRTSDNNPASPQPSGTATGATAPITFTRDGDWYGSTTIGPRPAPGTYNVNVQATDAAGNTSVDSATFTVPADCIT